MTDPSMFLDSVMLRNVAVPISRRDRTSSLAAMPDGAVKACQRGFADDVSYIADAPSR